MVTCVPDTGALGPVDDRGNSFIWMDARAQLLDLSGCPEGGWGLLDLSGCLEREGVGGGGSLIYMDVRCKLLDLDRCQITTP